MGLYRVCRPSEEFAPVSAQELNSPARPSSIWCERQGEKQRMYLGVLCMVLSAYPSGGCCGPASCKHTIKSSQSALVTPSSTIGDSKNFHVESHSAHCDARKLAECCESWRGHLQTKWLGSESSEDWIPRCRVVVHARREI